MRVLGDFSGTLFLWIKGNIFIVKKIWIIGLNKIFFMGNGIKFEFVLYI